ncbi:nuclear transport factor 2 family protein [Bacillus marasmi]|uniref:nuclear transport factor 2 family protein n=1 Tax=Bacillus marasmi TaxID=1926279 RepID=UPI001FE4CC59|nr:nuclear transport factor 2 family protein [Bacillus marasmi]
MEHSVLADHILNLEKSLMNYKYKDFDELLADDFLEFGSSGNYYDKKAQLGVVKGIDANNLIKFTE